jgi:hypothetical protein
VRGREPHSEFVDATAQVGENVFAQVLDVRVAHPLEAEDVLQKADHLTLQRKFPHEQKRRVRVREKVVLGSICTSP